MAQPSAITMYDICAYVTKPATLRRKCSYVELVAQGEQPPKWVVTHHWGQPFVQVVAESQPLGAPIVMAVGSSSPAQAASLSAALADADRQLVQTEAELAATHLDAASSESTLKSELGHMQQEIQRLRAESERLREQLASETASVEAATRRRACSARAS